MGKQVLPTLIFGSSLTAFRGGVRGIVELEVLRALEQQLGGNLPIQAFFDLMVGTRYVRNNLEGVKLLIPVVLVESLR
jgi:hypothetical protein